MQLLTEGYIYFEQAKAAEQPNAPAENLPRPRKKVPIDKKIYRFFKKRLDRALCG